MVGGFGSSSCGCVSKFISEMALMAWDVGEGDLERKCLYKVVDEVDCFVS